MYNFLAAIVFFTILPSTGSNIAMLDHYSIGNRPNKQVKLSGKLQEISGLAVTPDGRLFAHDDEQAVIYQIDHENGKIVKQFFVGPKKPLKGDFEGLSIVGNDFYLVTSGGKLYQFSEGKNKQGVDYQIHKTGLSEKYNIEGLCYDADTNCLLLACKRFAGKNLEHMRSVYAFSLDRLNLDKKPRFIISIDDIAGQFSSDISRKIGEFFLLIEPIGFAPSGIEKHPDSGSFFILSSQSRLIAEIDSTGTLLTVQKLSTTFHEQPEGICFLPDLSMVISDEGQEQKASLSIYNFVPDK